MIEALVNRELHTRETSKLPLSCQPDLVQWTIVLEHTTLQFIKYQSGSNQYTWKGTFIKACA